MKIPRDLSGQELIKSLQKLGYEPTRQTDSHIRLTTEKNSTHHITIPNHSPLKIGTLSGILKDVADHFQISREELLRKILQ